MHALKGRAPNNVAWHGFLAGRELDKFFEQSHILVLASLGYEGFPNVATRAMAIGKSVVASDIGYFPEIIRDEVTGRLFQVGNIRVLSEKIDPLYHDAQRCVQMGTAAQDKAFAAYSPDAVYKSLLSVYERAEDISR